MIEVCLPSRGRRTCAGQTFRSDVVDGLAVNPQRRGDDTGFGSQKRLKVGMGVGEIAQRGGDADTGCADGLGLQEQGGDANGSQACK